MNCYSCGSADVEDAGLMSTRCRACGAQDDYPASQRRAYAALSQLPRCRCGQLIPEGAIACSDCLVASSTAQALRGGDG